MAKSIIALMLMLLVASSAFAHPDSNTKSNIDSVNPASGSFGDQNYPPELYGFMANEDAYRSVEYGFGNFVYVGVNANACLGTTGAGLTMTPASCIAYNAGWRGTEVGSITFPNNSVCWVAMDENTTGNNAGLPNFTRVGSTHYLTDCVDAATPTMPYDAQLLMKVTTSGGAITAVLDERTSGASLGPVTGGDVIFHTINPRNLDGTDTIGPFNMLGALNIMDQPGAYASMETQSVTTNGTTAITATGIGTTHFGAVPHEWVAIYGAGPTPSVSTPTGINASAMSTNVSPVSGTKNTTFQTGCNVIDATGSITSGDNHLFVNNDALYEVGNTITVVGAGSGGDLTTTVTATTKGTNGGDYYTLAANASTTVTAAAVTGGNCTSTRLYRVRALDVAGGMSAPTATQTLTTTANALNWQNFISFQVDTQSNATAYALEGCEGAACSNWQLIDIQVPTYTFATPSFSFPYLDALLPTNNGTKTAPATITLHDFGLGYGTDYIQGSALPSGAVNQILFTKLNSVSANSAVLANAATQTGTFTMVHDIGPAINSAIVQATTQIISGPDTRGSTVPILIPAAPQGDGYSLVTGINADYTNNLQILSYTNLIDVDTSQGSCISQGACWNMLNYRGPLGGTAVSVQNANNANIQHLGVNALTTMGVCLDLDETSNFTGETTTNPNIDGMSCGQASVGYRFANINTSNVEFGNFKHLNFNATNSSGAIASGGIGILLNSGNSLRHGCSECQIGGQIGVYNIGSMQFDGGQIGNANGISVWTPPYVADDIVLRNLRMEGISRAFYGPVGGSIIGENGPEFDTVQVTYFKNLPDGIIFAIPAAGQTKITHSKFGAAGGNGSGDRWVGTNSFYMNWSQGHSTLSSNSNKYPGGISNPFVNLTLGSAAVPFVVSQGDTYANTSDFGFIDPLPALVFTPPTSNEIQSPCPFTLSKMRGTKYRTACGMTPGQIIAFPVDQTTGNNWGSFDINLYGSIVCHYDYANANEVSLHGPIENVTGAAAGCTAIQDNAGTINVYGDSNNIYIQNNTVQGNTEVLVSGLTGAHE